MSQAPSVINILLIEDSDADAHLFASLLSEADQRIVVTRAKDGESALERLRAGEENHPDLIVLDYHLPGRDGIETVTILRTLEGLGSVPVVFVSGLVGANRPDLKGHQNTAFFPKPDSLENYQDFVKELVTKWLPQNLKSES